MKKKDDTSKTFAEDSSTAGWTKGKGRRSFLQATGAFAVAALGGCSSDSDASGASIVDSGAPDGDTGVPDGDTGVPDGDAGALDGDGGLDATDGSPDADGGVIHGPFEAILPDLNWQAGRSDWLNVKTQMGGIGPAAVGDGVADDTAALQAAITECMNGTEFSTVYLPPGNYRITGELTAREVSGNFVIGLRGHGRGTTISWDGPVGGTMLNIFGTRGATWIGINWEGNNTAARGMIHRGGFTSKDRVEHMAFRNFTFQGSGTTFEGPPRETQGYVESSTWRNCLFVNCGRGMGLKSSFGGGQNNLDWVNNITYCEFIDCGYGILSDEADFYASNNHFERSTIADVAKFDQRERNGISLRRCTSVGSRMFYDSSDFSQPVIFQDCHVKGWTNPDRAIFYGSTHPLQMIDCSFTDAPSANPPVYLNNAVSIVHSQNTTSTAALFGGNLGRQLEIPAGSRTGVVTSAEQHFFMSVAKIPGKVFDAKADFGAPTGGADARAALQACIDAAKAEGNGAIAYIPRGDYSVSGSLVVNGANYYVGGCGMQETNFANRPSRIGPTSGAASQPTMLIQNAVNVHIEYLTCNQGNNSAPGFRQESTNSTVSSVYYDRVSVQDFGTKVVPDNLTGNGHFDIRDLTAGSIVVISGMHVFGGELNFTNCNEATILCRDIGSHSTGTVRVRGTNPNRTGFFGVMFGHCNFRADDNQSLVVSDSYMEQKNVGAAQHEGRYIWLSGSDALPSGMVTFSNPGRVDARYIGNTPPYEVYVRSENYKGQVTSAMSRFNYFGDASSRRTAYRFLCNGTNALDVVFLGSSFERNDIDGLVPPSADGGANIVTHRMNCSQTKRNADGTSGGITNILQPNSTALASAALDHLRQLGEVDLQLKF